MNISSNCNIWKCTNDRPNVKAVASFAMSFGLYTLFVKILSVKSDEFFFIYKFIYRRIINADERFLSTKSFAISEIF